MARSVLSIVAGSICWTVPWLLLNQLVLTAFADRLPDNGIPDHPAILLLILTSSVVFSVVAGYITAAIARRAEVLHAFSLGVLQLAIGIFVQIQYWDAMPLWYHLCFLSLLVPGNVLGGWVRRLRHPVIEPVAA